MVVNSQDVRQAGISQRATDYIYNVIDPEQRKSVLEDKAFQNTINAIKSTDLVPGNAIEITTSDSNAAAQIENGKGKTFILRGDFNFGRTLTIPSDATIYVDGTITMNGSHNPQFYDDENTGNSVDAVFRVDDQSNVKLIGVNNAKLVGNQRSTGVYIEGSSNVEVRGFDIGNVWEGVVSHWGNSDVKILNNYIHDVGKRAIWSLGSKRTQAAHNFIENAGGDGFDWDAYSTASVAYENVVVGWRRWAGFVEEGAQDSYFAENVAVMAEFEYKHPNPNKVPEQKHYTMGWADNGTTAGISRLTQNNYFIGNTLFRPSSYTRKNSGGGYFAKRNQKGKGQTYFWGNEGNVGFSINGNGDKSDSAENPQDSWYKANIEATVAPGQSTLDKFAALFPVHNITTPRPTPTPSQSLVKIALVNAETEQIVAGYEDLGANGTIDLKGLNLSQYSLVAQINADDPNAGAVQSVKFESSLGNRIESVQPYALFGDTAGDFDGQAASTGDYSVKAIAYTGASGQGQAIALADINYTIVDTTGMPTPPATPIRFEAENMAMTGYHLESGSFASGGKFVGLVGGADNEVGQATLKFSQPTGHYDVLIGYFDENDGAAKLTVEKNQQVIDHWIFDKQLGNNIASAETLTTRQVATGLEINAGDTFTLKGFEQGVSSNAEHARIDYIEFVPSTLENSGHTTPSQVYP